jgi:Group II intron, maturase-specific domain
MPDSRTGRDQGSVDRNGNSSMSLAVSARRRGVRAAVSMPDGTSFDFLGLTHVWGRSRNGKNMVRQVTAKDRYARAVAAVTAWCREHRNWSFRDQHRRLSSMMRGHFAYYGVGGNSRRLRWFANQVVRVWRKWLSRRHRDGVVPWARFNALLARHPLPSVRIHPRQPLSDEGGNVRLGEPTEQEIALGRLYHSVDRTKRAGHLGQTIIDPGLVQLLGRGVTDGIGPLGGPCRTHPSSWPKP